MYQLLGYKMTALERFNEFETQRLYELFIILKEDEVSKNSLTHFYLLNVGSIFFLRKERIDTPLQFIFKPMILEIEWNNSFEIFTECY